MDLVFGDTDAINNTTKPKIDDPQLTVDNSIKAFTSALLFNAALGAGLFAAFCVVRHWSKKIYQPRTYLVNKDIRSPELPPGAFSWITASFKVKDTELLDRVGLDAYMFLRFLRMSAFFFAGCSLLSLPILVPLNVVGGVGDSGLGSMTIGNVQAGWRLWFHLTLTYIFSFSAIILLWREMREYTRRRHAFLMSEKHIKTPQATTILVTAIPKGLNTEEAMYNIFNRFPGGVAKVWLNRNPKNLLKLCRERDEVVTKLEMAEYNYIRSAYKKKATGPVRPIGRTSSIPYKGEKVDLVDFYTDKLCQLNQEIRHSQQSGTVTSLNSAFIQFRSQFAAHSAVQTVVHPKPFRMAPMYSEISPLEVVWDNMNLNTVIRKGRHLIIFALTTAMILLWTIPTFVVSSLATIRQIVHTFPFLVFLENFPPWLLAIIQGVLPPILLAGLMALLPVLLIMMSTYEGHVRQSNITLSVMSKYFFFLVVNVLLISTLTGGILQAVEDLKVTGFTFDSIIQLVSNKLPLASTFFITYVIFRAFVGPVLELMQIVPLLLNILYTQLLAKSPRQIWDVQGRLQSVHYGIIFPQQTLMFCIGILYSTVAPLVVPFVTFYFTLNYFVYRHQFLYVYHQPNETGGLAFPKAVKQVYTGIFISQILLFGIFLLKSGQLNATPQLVLLFILIGITVLSLTNMNEAFDPLVTFLPVALFSKDLHMDADGVVTDGNEKKTDGKIPDIEFGGVQDDGLAMSLDNLSRRNLTSDRVEVPEDNHPQLRNRGGHGDYKDEYGGYSNPHDFTATPGSPPTMSAQDPLQHPKGFYQTQQGADSVGSRYLLPRQPSHPYHEDDMPRLDRPVSFLNRSSSYNTSRPASFVDRPAAYNAEASEYHHHMQTQEELDRRAEAQQKDSELEMLQDQAYCHPAIYNEQKPVWLPMDERGLMQAEINKLAQLGIICATDGAVLDSATAKARVSGLVYAPGEEIQYKLERGEQRMDLPSLANLTAYRP
ncbi:calcium permeable stress-gated cation channel [Entomortierella parvispora]|uniref:Calcium permeable stress-gated cation channel n=1 Tax=Entomortierella parvispora TaxID=205924 RepID=A0A9P3H463_9FUNG|nr:calcium permeable stress-gated cation channel [Entomortierella parvispora]